MRTANITDLLQVLLVQSEAGHTHSQHKIVSQETVVMYYHYCTYSKSNYAFVFHIYRLSVGSTLNKSATLQVQGLFSVSLFKIWRSEACSSLTSTLVLPAEHFKSVLLLFKNTTKEERQTCSLVLHNYIVMISWDV